MWSINTDQTLSKPGESPDITVSTIVYIGETGEWNRGRFVWGVLHHFAGHILLMSET